MVNKDLTKYLASLSKISFSKSEEENITRQMHNIITLMDKVKEFKGNVYTSSHNSIKYQNLRDDTSDNTCNREDAVSNAKCIKDNCVVVPKII